MPMLAITQSPLTNPILSDAITDTARAILQRQNQPRKRRATKASKDLQTRVCAVIATLPKAVKVQDVAKIYGFTPSHLSKMRAQAFAGVLALPETMQDALKRSFVPKATEPSIDPIVAATLAVK